ncbi:HNH endonuclease [Sphingomonas sanguinis]|uniref:HNH endonuclease n=1 Tax=Sphingomonas sp. LC-1 TaxID=3110957 RepID=UPI0021BA4409|nr:HNH endonuclease [Sphingomonas sp. LC-1]MCT8003729.1 HNH endonuclease [Sphingomonas sp. LC-1]
MSKPKYRSNVDNQMSEFRTNRRKHRELASPCVRCLEEGHDVDHTNIDHRDPNGGNGWSNLDPLCHDHKILKDDLEQARKVPFRKNGRPSNSNRRLQEHLMIGYVAPPRLVRAAT